MQSSIRLGELLHSVERGIYIKPQTLTLSEYLQQWLDGYVKTNCSLRTLDGYQSIVNRHLISNLGHIYLARLQAGQIQQYYDHALMKGRANGKGGLSAQTVLHINRVLFETLSHAVRRGVLVHNVAELVDSPRASKAKVKTLLPEEVVALLSAARGNSLLRYYLCGS
jgi:site-specific recombinase XerD